MPARVGAVQINTTLPESLAAQLGILAKDDQYHGSKSEVLEAALRAFVDGRSTLTSLDGVHDHLAKITAEMVGALHTLTDQLQETQHQLNATAQRMTLRENQLTTMERAIGQKLDSLTRAYDGLRKILEERSTKGGFWSSFRQ